MMSSMDKSFGGIQVRFLDGTMYVQAIFTLLLNTGLPTSFFSKSLMITKRNTENYTPVFC